MSEIKVTNLIDKVLSSMKDKKAEALEIIGGKAESYAKKLCPVDTGNLRNSITHHQRDADTEVLSTTVEYAPYVEMGHRTVSGGHVGPKPFLRPAAENHGDEYRKILERVMKS